MKGRCVASSGDSSIKSAKSSWASIASLHSFNSICGTSALSVLHVCISEVTHVQQAFACLILHVVFV